MDESQNYILLNSWHNRRIIHQTTRGDYFMEGKYIGTQSKKPATWLLIVGIIFIASTLRAPLTSVGSLIGSIRDDLQISNTLSGMLTTLPLIAFALFSPIVPKLGRKYGINRVVLFSVIFLTAGITIRSLSGIGTLFIGTAIIGLAISVSNVLLPSLVKKEFTNHLGTMTGVYSISMNLTGAIASGISVPIAVGLGFGWSGALGIWGILSIIALFVWFPQIRHEKNKAKANSNESIGESVNIWRSKLAWQVTLFMGLQSMFFYVLITWLPEILKPQGISPGQSGWLLSLMQLAMLPFTFIVPIIAGRMSSQRSLVLVTAGLFLTGIIGLQYGSIQLVYLWVILLGIGIGFAFSLAMMFFSLRSESAIQAADLSGMAQSIGYLLAAIGPTFFGFLYDVTNNWTIPLLLLAGVSILILIFGLGAARDQVVSKA